MDHRGRLQVHGNASVLLDSEKWNEEEALPALKAHHLLSGLEDRVRQSHRGDFRILHGENAFTRSHGRIDKIAAGGGHGPYKFTEPKPSRKDQRRVDTEIQAGRAFI
jgi:hypothetical protein